MLIKTYEKNGRFYIYDHNKMIETIEIIAWLIKCFKEATIMIYSYEKNGKFYFFDGKNTIETTELIDCSLVVYDSDCGYIYKSQCMDQYEKKDDFIY